MEPPRTLALFDVDGTIVAAGDPDHHEAFVLAAAEVHGVVPSLDGVPLGGRLDRAITADALIAAGVDPERVRSLERELMDRLGHHYRRLVPPGGRRDRLLPGVADLLAACAPAGVAVAVLTGGASTLVPWKLEAAGVWHHVGVGSYGDEADERHELVELACARAEVRWGRRFPADRVMIVGDTPRDIEAARVAGVGVVAVATGGWTGDQLAEHEPDALFADCTPTEAVLAALGARV